MERRGVAATNMRARKCKERDNEFLGSGHNNATGGIPYGNSVGSAASEKGSHGGVAVIKVTLRCNGRGDR